MASRQLAERWYPFILFFVLVINLYHVKCDRSFTVDFNNRTFLKDGKAFQYVSGSIHYSRVPSYYWKDRLQKMYMAGLDAAQIYVPWNFHEQQPGNHTFTGDHDLVQFIKTAQDVGLLVIVRAGPYICGEWDFGGIPAWILKSNGSVVVRSMDPGYLAPATKWLDVLLPMLKPLLYENGGPIIMTQVENEYGSYFACDHDYMTHLVSTFRRHLGNKHVLFTTDGNAESFLKCGAHPELLTTVDFGPTANVTDAFQALVKWNHSTPLVNSEFYTGWLDYWGSNHANISSSGIVQGLHDMWKIGASVNMYMFEGGTNFGYTNGADPPFQVCPTSYDYDAPLSEAGDTSAKYHAIRDALAKIKGVPSGNVPSNTKKWAYGNVTMKPIATVLELLEVIGPTNPFKSRKPLTMENIGQNEGFTLYRHVLKRSFTGGQFNVTGIRDIGYVMVDGFPKGIVDRDYSMIFNLVARKGQVLDIIVENQGHINFNTQLNNNSKGILSDVFVNHVLLEDWEIYPLNFEKLYDLSKVLRKFELNRTDPIPSTPAVYAGMFVVPQSLGEAEDTFFDPTGWFKGQLFINGFNLGRYWPTKGPQVTLFVPKSILKPYPQPNYIMMVELQLAPSCEKSCTVSFVNKPIINDNTAGFHNIPNSMNREKPWLRSNRNQIGFH